MITLAIRLETLPESSRWPGKIPAGTSCNQIAGNIDMLPTFAKIVGADLPKDRLIDGREITSLMFDPKAGPVRDTQLYFGGLKLVAIRKGDWKLFLNAPGDDTQAQSNVEDGLKGKPAGGKERGGRSAGLYNLASDPGEVNDVAAEHPDIVTKMSEEARKRGAEIQEHKRPPGQHGAG